MGGAAKTVKKTVTELGGDVSSTLQATARGDLGGITAGIEGIGRAGHTAYGLMPGANVLGLKSPTEQRDAQREAELQAARDAGDAAAAAELDRINKIATGVGEAVKLRQRSPGRAQTLLTSGMTPSASNTNTLLTSAVRNMGQ